MKLLLILLIFALTTAIQAEWRPQQSGTKVQFRGLCAVSDKVCWAAGSTGTFARTADGENWISHQIPGLENLTFRSIKAWSANSATLLAIGAGHLSRIYHTDDGGKSWTLQFSNPDPTAFYDCIQFWDRNHGIALSDPVNGKFRILITSNGGKNWHVAPTAGMPGALTGEGAFAASGTCLVVHGSQDVWFGTGGGAVSRVFHSNDRGKTWSVSETPVPAQKATSGVFGLLFISSKVGFAVGGDYKDSIGGSPNFATTFDGGKSWIAIGSTPAVLYECLGLSPDGHLQLVGPNLIAHSANQQHWEPFQNAPGMHTCSFASGVGWAAGDGGHVFKWTPS
jgi:photosystem II stability/assembly factor-like uncharacterized protein